MGALSVVATVSAVGIRTELRDNLAMRSRPIETPAGMATLRLARAADEPGILEVRRSCAGYGSAWGGEQFRSQLRVFPDGQLCVEGDGGVIAASSAHIVHLGRDAHRPHTHAGITDDGYFHNHDASGDTLYVSHVCVDPEWSGREVGDALVAEHLETCRRLNLRRVLVAAPTESSVEALTKRGFAVRAVMRGYTTGSPSDAVLLEWTNEGYVKSANDAASIRVALVQYGMREVDDFDAFARQVEYFVRAASGYKADFVLFPEFTSLQLLSSRDLRNKPPLAAIDGLSHLTDAVFGLFSRLAQRHRMHIIGGSHPVPAGPGGTAMLHNVCPIALPDGRVLMQPKLHITPSETEAWGLRGGAHLAVIPTAKAKIGVLICYDSEFPEAARYLADRGVDILFVPYCTDDRQGYLRVRWCCQARAIENQIYVAASGLVGNLPGAAGIDVHYGRAAVFTPSDFGFGRDGIQAEADANVETLLVTDLDLGNLRRAREYGSVRPRLDRRPDLFESRAQFAANELQEYPLVERDPP